MKRAMKLLAVVMVLALTIAISAIPALADYTAVTPAAGGSTSFNKNLVVASSADVPDVTFTYTIAPGTAVAPTSTTYEILAGIGTPTIGAADFDLGDTTTAGVPGDATDTAHKYATEAVSVDFSGISFPAPGIYRYVITEVNSPAIGGVTYDSNLTRILDVVVVTAEDANHQPTNVLSVDSYVLRDSAANIAIDGNYADGAKSTGYTNSYEDFDLTFSKQITGNQADKDAEFPFVLSIANANPGTYNISINGTVQATPITVGSDGTYTGNYSLGDGDTVTVTGLPTGATYTITETPGNYVASVATDGGAATAAATTSGTMNADHSVEFTNTRNGVIPTGVLITIAPFAIGLLIFGAAIVFVVAKRRRESY